MATMKTSYVKAVLAAAALGTFASASQAGLELVYDLRMADGTKTAMLSAAAVVPVKLYATLWGTDADLNNDYWASGYFGVSSSQGSTALITAGNVTLSTTSFNGPFNDVSASAGKAYSYSGSRYVSGSAQTTYQPASDGITDWGGSVSTSVSNWAHWSAASQQHSSGLSGGVSVNDGQGHSGYEYLMATFTINATTVNNTTGAKTFFNVDTPVCYDAAKVFVKNGGSSSYMTLAGEGTMNLTGLQVSIGAPIEFNGGWPIYAPSYTLSAGTTASRVMKGQNAAVSVTIHNQGLLLEEDSLSYTGLTLVPTAGVAMPGTTNVVVAPGGSSTVNGTFTGNTSGPYTLTASVGSVANANAGTVGTPHLSGTAGTTVTVLDDRVVNGSAVSFGRVMNGMAGNSLASNLTTSGDSDHYTNVTVAATSSLDVAGNGVTGNGLGTMFNSASAAGSRTLSATFSGTGAKSGTVIFATTGEGLTGESPINVGVGYTATVVDNRVVVASAVDFGRVLVNMPQSGTSNLVTSGDSNHFTAITVAGQPFNSAGSTGTYTLNKTFTTVGPQSGVQALTVVGEGLAGESPMGVTVAYSSTALNRRTAVASATANFGRVLGNAAVSGAATIHAPGSTDQYTNVTVNGVVFFDAEHGVGDKTTNVAATTGYASVNTLTLATSEELVGTGTLNVDTSATVVGMAIKGPGATLGDTIKGKPIGGHLANMYATDNSGITVKFLAGVTDPDNEVFMRFRNPDSGREPPLARGGMLSSDVVDLSFGDTVPAYVLSMTYKDPGMPYAPYADLSDLIAHGQIFLISKSGACWQNAVGDNTGNVAGSGFENMSWDAFSGLPANSGKTLADLMGYYGVDTGTHTVWAVLDHATEFSVAPEPATVGLLGLGALGLLRRRRRGLGG